MALIDLTRQAGAASTGSLLLTSTAVTSSVTGLYEVEWGKLNPTYALGQGNLTLGEGNTLSVGYLELENNIIYDSGSNEAIVLTGGGSIRIPGDLVVEGDTVTQNVATFRVEDPIIDLNFSGSVASSVADSGLRVGRGGATEAQLLWDHSATRWVVDNADGSQIHIVGSSTTDTLTNKTITGLASSTMASNADLTFSGGGEVLGLPATASADDAAISKIYAQQRFDYLRKSYVKKSASITIPSSASFTAVSASSPDGVTSTTEDDFIFFINGQYMEHDALSIQQEGSNFILLVSTGSIGYDLEADDEILAWGKFNS
jgi:hypothetical protein